MNIVEFITTIFVMVDDFCEKFYPPRKLRSRGFLPKLYDSEVITMEIVGEYLGYSNDKAIYNYFKRHWIKLFPNMPDRSNFARQCANLLQLKNEFFQYLKDNKDKFMQIIDSMPIEVCKFVRARYSKLFKDTASYGKWFGRTFFGFRLHIAITDYGMINKFIIAPANFHDIHFAENLLENENSCKWAIGDKGYRSKPLAKRLWDNNRIFFHTSLRRIDKKESPLPKKTIRYLTGKRRLIETVAGQLHGMFNIKMTFARDFWHLCNRIVRKITAHTICVFLNLKLGRDPLKLESVIVS